jgi:hypothetical protein
MLQTEIEMQPCGGVFLNDEAAFFGRLHRRRVARGFGGAGEIAHALVAGEFWAGQGRLHARVLGGNGWGGDSIRDKSLLPLAR